MNATGTPAARPAHDGAFRLKAAPSARDDQLADARDDF